MPIQTIESPRLYQQIAEQLSALIASGEFASGERLPSERELATLLGVSRPSVREAFVALEIAGSVEVRVGLGVFVAAPRPAAATDPETRARWLIEGEVAAVAAREATPKDLAHLRRSVEEMRRLAFRKRSADAADREFHLGIATATHNKVLLSVVQNLWDHGRGPTRKRTEHHCQTPELRPRVLRDHQAILESLEARDERGARIAMRQHLDHVERLAKAG